MHCLLRRMYFRVNIVYIEKDGTRIPVAGKIGDNVMYLAHRHQVELEGNQNFYLNFEYRSVCVSLMKDESLRAN